MCMIHEHDCLVCTMYQGCVARRMYVYAVYSAALCKTAQEADTRAKSCRRSTVNPKSTSQSVSDESAGKKADRTQHGYVAGNHSPPLQKTENGRVQPHECQNSGHKHLQNIAQSSRHVFALDMSTPEEIA